MKELSTDDFWNWDKKYGIDYGGSAYLGLDKCVDFEKDILLELGNVMWRKHQSIYQDHLKYIHNDIVKPFCVGILRYTKRVQEM